MSTPPSAPSPPPEAVQIVRTGSIIGGVFGGLAFIAVVGLAWYWIRRRHPKQPKDEKTINARPVDEEAPPPEYTKGEGFEVADQVHTAVELEQPRGSGEAGRAEIDGVGSQVHEMPVEMCELPGDEGRVELEIGRGVVGKREEYKRAKINSK